MRYLNSGNLNFGFGLSPVAIYTTKVVNRAPPRRGATNLYNYISSMFEGNYAGKLGHGGKVFTEKK